MLKQPAAAAERERVSHFRILSKLDGGTATALTASADDDTGATVAPDGTTMLFWRRPHGDRQAVPTLMRATITGGPATAIPLTDAKSLLFVHCARRAGGGCELARHLTSGGDTIAFSRFDPQTGEGAAIATLPGTYVSARTWAVSPDGATVADLGDDDKIHLITVATGKDRSFAPKLRCGYQSVAFTADGRALFATCIGERPRPYKVVRVELDGSAHVLLEEPAVWFDKAIATPDGRSLVVGASPWVLDLWTIDL
jgi:hypothetical protein